VLQEAIYESEHSEKFLLYLGKTIWKCFSAAWKLVCSCKNSVFQ